MSDVFCDDCLNPCDEWEYEFGHPNCELRQDWELRSKWDKGMTMRDWHVPRTRHQVDIGGKLEPSND